MSSSCRRRVGFEGQLFDGGDQVQCRRGFIEPEHFLARERVHARDLGPVAPALQQLRRVGGGILLELIEQFEQKPRSWVVGHFELGELGSRNPGGDGREMDHELDRLGDEALAAAAIAGTACG